MIDAGFWPRWTIGCSLAALSVACITSPALTDDTPSKVGAEQDRDAVAIVLGTTIYRDELHERVPGASLRSLLLYPLGEAYLDENDLRATDEEIDAFIESQRRTSGDADEEESGDFSVSDQELPLVRFLVERWKLDRALYERYGGVVVANDVSLREPIGAYRAFLEKEKQHGRFEIFDADIEEAMWNVLVVNHYHEVIDADAADFAKPWWTEVEERRAAGTLSSWWAAMQDVLEESPEAQQGDGN